MSTKNEYKCSKCGGPVSVSSGRHGGMCSKCARVENSRRIHENKEAMWRRLDKEQPNYCIMCGKQIPWNYTHWLQKTKTCSPHCTSLFVQSRLKESPEHLEDRLIAYIREQGRYVSLKELRQVFHISDKLIYSRGLSCPELNRKAGNYVPANDKSITELTEAYAEIIKTHRGIQVHEAARLLGVSYEYLVNSGIDIGGLRKSLGIHNRNSRTREEVRSMVLTWLKTQPVYCTAREVCKNLHIDFKCMLQKKGLDIAELNIEAGHKVVPVSYYENWTKYRLKELGLAFESQKTFPDCRYKNPLRFDFWLSAYGVLIEVDGLQHSRPSFGKDAFERTKTNDAIKTRYAEMQGIPLFRIPTQPHDTFKQRLNELIEHIKGLPCVSEEVHTDSNCGELLPGNAGDNPQPSLEDLDTCPDLGF